MKSLLKFITCGSVDDGKSTLIGHMIYDAKLLFADQEKMLLLDSKLGNRDGDIDYSLLLDGLIEEREQGITIDVAYRFFNTEKRSFIVADCPGHEEYTRNMAVGASFADLAVILVDITKGIMSQTKRHLKICEFMGIKHYIIAVNKMDLINYSCSKFYNIKKQFENLIKEFTNISSIDIIPVSATEGDNINKLSKNMPWYDGSSLLRLLENIEIIDQINTDEFVMPVQRVTRPNCYFRGFEGQVESGNIEVGKSITVLPNNEQARIKNIYVCERESKSAQSGQAITLQLDREIDISRGCVIVDKNNQYITDVLQAQLLWMDEKDFDDTDYYMFKCGTKTLPIIDIEIDYIVDINNGKMVKKNKLKKNQIAVCTIILREKTVLNLFNDQKVLGSFILISRLTNNTAGCGTIKSFAIKPKDQLMKLNVTPKIRAELKGQKPFTLWFTGLSGSGKSTLATAVEKELIAIGKHTMLLDGDILRRGINSDLEFSKEDRRENIRRITHISKIVNDAGVISIVSSISPFYSDRTYARHVIGDGFIEIFVDTPLEECEKRDVKGFYKKVHSGKINNFTGISSPYEKPKNPEVVVKTIQQSVKESTHYILEEIKRYIS